MSFLVEIALLNKTLSYIRQNLGKKNNLVWLFVLVLSLLIILFAYLHLNCYQKNLTSQADKSLKTLSHRIGSEIVMQQRLLDGIVMGYQKQLLYLLEQASASHKSSQAAESDFPSPEWNAIQQLVLQLLPENQQFALLNVEGEVVLDGNNFFMANACKAQVEKGLSGFVVESKRAGAHLFHNDVNHYDLVQYFGKGKLKGALIVSIPMNHLKEHLKALSSEDFKVLMLNKFNPTQVILSSLDSFTMDTGSLIEPEQLNQNLAYGDIENTEWRLYFLEDNEVLKAYRFEVYAYVAAAIMLLALFAQLLLSYLARLNQSDQKTVQDSLQIDNYQAGPLALLILDGEKPNLVSFFSANRVEHAAALKRSVVINRPFVDLIHPLDRNKWRALLQQIEEQKKTNTSILLRLHNIGKLIDAVWMKLDLSVQFAPDDSIEKIVVYLQNSSSSKLAEIGAKELIYKLLSPVVVTDSNGVIYDANPAAANFFQVKRSELLDSPLTAFLSLDTAQPYRQFLAETIIELNDYSQSVGQDSKTDKLSNLTASGKNDEQRLVFRNRADGFGDCTLTIETLPSVYSGGYVHFISPSPEAADSVTEDFCHFQQSYYEASLSRFNVGHHIAEELQELMSFLRGISDRLKFTFVDRVSKIHADEIRSRSEAVSRSLQDFKFLALMEESYEIRSFDAYIAIEESIHLLGLKARWNGVHVDFRYESSCPLIWSGYENRTKQILLQLLSYMIDRLPCQSQSVLVDCGVNQTGKQALKISILGLDVPDKCEHYYSQLQKDFKWLVEQRKNPESLFRISASDPLKGLYLSDRLIAFMGGELATVGELQTGFGIAFELPMKADNGGNEEAQRDNSSLKDVFSEQPLKGARLLIVESDTIVSDVLQDIFIRLGAKVDRVDSGVDAISFWRNYSHLYCALFIEENAEVIDATEVVHYIREEEDNAHLSQHFPVILITDRKEDEDSGYSELFDDLLQKPLVMDQLLQVVLKHCKND